MSYVKPDMVLESMIQAGAAKAKLPARDLFLRGGLSGALLGFATTLALTATAQTGAGIVGALVFPVGFVMIVLLGLELVTGNFALVPLGIFERRIGGAAGVFSAGFSTAASWGILLSCCRIALNAPWRARPASASGSFSHGTSSMILIGGFGSLPVAPPT